MRKRSSGWMLADALVGIGILTVLAGVVVTEISWRTEADKRLENLREATNLAELALDQMQQGPPPAASKASDVIRIEKIAGGATVPQHVWVRVVASHAGQSASLIGLVRADAMGGN
jgi:type II secretory pathway pseudopilin PulG